MNPQTLPELGCLRAIRPDELEMMLAWRNAPGVRANMYTRHEIGLEEHLGWWARIQSRTDQRYLMYESKGAPLGIVAFNGIDAVNGNSAWAFYAAPGAPKGSGSRMEFLALEFAFGELKLHKLCCEVLAFNSPVIKLHQKFGFKVEGILREQHRLDGGFVDIHRLGIFAREWLECRDAMLAKLMHLPSGPAPGSPVSP
jgi:UDP-4-amino-4,6-dideoxy-N-acetyl-beta-L-altrosamine N-acetyltransferase